MGLRTLHVVTGLETGGAELMLVRLVSALPGLSIVVNLGSGGRARDKLTSLGVQVVDLNLTTKSVNSMIRFSGACWELRKIIKDFKPSVIQGWMYHANVMSTLVSRTIPKRPPVAWGIRQSLSSLDREKPLTRAVIQASRLASRTADKIVYNSTVARESHESFGFHPASGTVLANGFDTQVFAPSLKLRQQIRGEIGVDDDTFVIALFARYHPMKDHVLFCRAAAILVGKVRSVRFIMAGKEIQRSNRVLMQQLVTSGIDQHTTLLGERDDMATLYNGADVVSVTSRWGEAFPNVLAEAMACGVPCVTTDVGDAREVVGRDGLVIRPGDVDALIAAWMGIYSMSKELRGSLGQTLRARVQTKFDLNAITARYTALYEQLADPQARGGTEQQY